MERQLLLLKTKQNPTTLQAEALLLSELIHESTKMGKNERKIWRHKKKRKLDSMLCAILKCEKFYKTHKENKTKKPFKVQLNWKAHPLPSSRPSKVLLQDPGLLSPFPGRHLPYPTHLQLFSEHVPQILTYPLLSTYIHVFPWVHLELPYSE